MIDASRRRRPRFHELRPLSVERLEQRRLLAVDTIALIATHGQQACVLDNPSQEWPGAIVDSFREEFEAWSTKLKESSVIVEPPRIRTTYVKWDTCGAIERDRVDGSGNMAVGCH